MEEKSLLDMVFRSHQLLQTLESSPHDYGTGEVLFSSEIHTIVTIGKKGNCNLSELARDMSVSKPAASKFISKLTKSGYVNKTGDPANKRGVIITLTGKGMKAVSGHEEFIRKMFGPLKEVELELSGKDVSVIGSYLSSLIEECPWR